MNRPFGTLLLLSLLLPPATAADTPEEKGLAIFREADRRDTGFADFTATMLMVLRNRHGQESRRNMRIRTLEVPEDGDKSLVIFDTPRDVTGTAFLTFTHKVGDDDQWLYLPALKRVKRISGRNKSGSFMGSEFSYEDIASEEVEKYTYKWLRDETYERRECFVVERYPIDEGNSGYTRQTVWVDKGEYRTWKIDYYDRKDSLLKTLVLTRYTKHLDTYWRPEEMAMVNHQNGKSTTLFWSDYQFRVGLTDRDFSKQSLKRIR